MIARSFLAVTVFLLTMLGSQEVFSQAGHIDQGSFAPPPLKSSDVELAWSAIHSSYQIPADDRAVAIAHDSQGSVYVAGTAYGIDDYLIVKYDASGSEQWVVSFDAGGGVDRLADMVIDSEENLIVSGSGILGFTTVKFDKDGNEIWQVSYSGGESGETLAGICTDMSGNVYLGGHAIGANSYDYVTIKYDSGGNEEWVRWYDGPGQDFDDAAAIVLDSLGNVYITGTSFGVAANGRDYVTIKYDPLGNQQWLARYDGDAQSVNTDRATALVVDNSGNVYVTGESEGATRFQSVTVKYNANGEEQWVDSLQGSSGLFFSPSDIEIDKDGNILVVGRGSSPNLGPECVLIKYDQAGNILWQRTYEDQDYERSRPGDMEISGSGNIIVAGTISNQLNNDMFVITYNSSGNPIWNAFYNGLGNGHDLGSVVHVLETGEIFVAGHVESLNGDDDLVVVKFDSAGSPKWDNTYAGPNSSKDEATGIAVDKEGNVYVAGTSEGMRTGEDFLTVKYDPFGNEEWAARWDNPAGLYDRLTATTVDPDGNVIVTGSTFENGSDFLTIKYDPSGTQLWVERYNGPDSGSDFADLIGTDSAGGIYVAGFSDYGYALIKYAPDGNRLWVARHEAVFPNVSVAYPREMVIDKYGNTIIAGQVAGGESDWDIYVVKYSAEGILRWSSIYSGPTDYSDFPKAVEVDSIGDIYIAGRSSWFFDIDMVTIKFDSSGTQRWSTTYNGINNAQVIPSNMAIDRDGSVFVAGYSDDTLSITPAVVVIKYDQHGQELWQQQVPDQAADRDAKAAQIAIDNQSNIYLSSQTASGGGSADLLTIKFDSSGAKIWEIVYDSYGQGFDQLTDMALDNENNIYLAGYRFSGSRDQFITVKYIQPTNGSTPVPGNSPNEYYLFQNYPNPFNPATTIEFYLPQTSTVTLEIFNVVGQRIVETLHATSLPAGVNKWEWDGKDAAGNPVASGLYFYRLSAGDFVETRKMLLLH